jgi:drug/metabolite transporter (DMT)-like permease
MRHTSLPGQGAPRQTGGGIAVRSTKAPLALSPATLALLLATLAWGCSFTWAKAAGDGINQAAGLPSGALLGPLVLLAWRFTLAGLLWLCLFPAARYGWTRGSVTRSLLLGGLLWAAQTLQMLGLDRTSEAVNAFLTSLAVVFVPLIMLCVVRRPPAPLLWGAVALATCGVWLMTGAAPTGFGLGELLGLGCALGFAVHMILLGELGQRDSAWRLAVGQFFSVGMGSALACLYLDRGLSHLGPSVQWHLVTSQAVWLNVVLLVSVSTMLAYGLMFHFQPRLDPTRAALLYLAEPIFAALFAYVTVDRRLSAIALFGAALLLTANVLAEVLGQRRAPSNATPQLSGQPD